MYTLRNGDAQPGRQFATLEQARAALKSLLAASERDGYTVKLNDELQYQVSETETAEPKFVWIEDADGQRVMSHDAAEGG